MRYPKQRIAVAGRQMAYVDVGQGEPIVFLHGNANSSYMWRNIMPHLEGAGRLIAIDRTIAVVDDIAAEHVTPPGDGPVDVFGKEMYVVEMFRHV